MIYERAFYLAFKVRARGYGALSVRVTERQPSLESGEIAIKVTAKLPDVLFKRPLLTATIAVPENGVSPAIISADVAQNIGEIIRQQTGLDIKMTVEVPAE